MIKASDLMRFVTGVGRTAKAKKRRPAPIGALEPLESRWLMSANASSGFTLHEHRDVKFTADLGTFDIVSPGTGVAANINWGDGTSSLGVLTSEGTVDTDEIKFEVDGTHIYKKSGTFDIGVTVIQPGPPGTTYVVLVAVLDDTAIVPRSIFLLPGSPFGGSGDLNPLLT